MTNYQRGARLERLARAQLERAGYFVVRSAGSKGACDLVAWDAKQIKLIQVKSSGEVDKRAIEKLRKVPCPINGRREIWERDGGLKDWKVIEVE